MLTLITQILIASTAVLILAAMGLFVLRRKSVSMRHAWLCSIMIALIALPFLVPMLPVFAPIKKVEIAAKSAPSVVPPTITQLGKQPELTEAVAAPVAVPLQQQIPENLPVKPVLTTVQTSVPEPVVQETSKNFNPAMILALILCTGTAIRLLTLLKSMAAMRRVAKNALVFKNGSGILNLTDIRKQFGVHRDIPVMTHDQVEVPFAAGIIRPMIFLPRVMQSESPDKLRLVLMHEMAHIARRDVFWQLLSRIMLAVYWFHPLAWWLASRIRREREFACDDAVLLANDRTVDTFDTPEDYAMVLLDISQSLRRKSVILPGCTVAMAQTHQMESRIRAILDDARTRKPIGRFAATLLIVCVCSLTAFAGMFSPFAVEEKMEATSKEAKTETVEEAVCPPPPDLSFLDATLGDPTKLGVFKTGEKDRRFPDKDEYKIRGRVLMPDGTPAVNVDVFYFADNGYARAETNDDGYFTTMSVSPWNRMHFEFALGGVCPKTEDASWQWAAAPFVLKDVLKQPDEAFVIRLQQGVKINGTLTTDEEKLPALGYLRSVFIDCILDDENFNASQIWLNATEEGQFECWLAPGKYRFYPQKMPWDSAKIDMTIEKDETEKTVKLNLPTRSQIRVVRNDGTPIPGKVLSTARSLLPSSHQIQYPAFSPETDENGLAFGYFSPWENLVTCYDGEHKESGVLAVAGKGAGGEETAGKTYTLTVRPYVNGKVRLVDQTGKPLPRIKLEYDPAMQGNNGNVVSSVSRGESQTDENGVAELPNLVPGANYLLRLRGPVDWSEYDVSNNAEYRRALHEELTNQLIPVDVNATPGETIDLGDILVEIGNK